MILLNQAGRNRHEHICESLELFAAEVMPEFHDHGAGARRSGSGEVLGGELELDEIDTEPYNMVSLQSTKWKPGMAIPTPD